LLDAGLMGDRDLDRAAAALLAAAGDRTTRARAQAVAQSYFGLDTVGVARYRHLYEKLSS
jgi:hypothetical protein